MTIRLEDLDRCFHGIVPGLIATATRDGVPNVGYLSAIHYVDARHVALSCQFFNKTRQNLDENPLATVEIYEPMTFQAYRMRLRFDHSETSGPLYDAMAIRIQAIASQCGMAGIFRLRSADVCEVLSIEMREGFLEVPPHELAMFETPLPDGPMTEIRGLTLVSERIRQAADLESLLGGALAALAEVFGFQHGMILLPDEQRRRLLAIATHGYGSCGIGAEVAFGEGLIGAVAEGRKLLRVASVATDLAYARAIRSQIALDGSTLAPEIALPGLPDAASQLAVPLLVRDRLVGVLALECRDTLTFAQWHEAFLQVLANQIAAAIDRMLEENDDDSGPVVAPAARAPAASAKKRVFSYFRNDDCVFVDGEYLIRNVPAKILWKLLRAHEADGRVDFANRELRLDPSLGLPPVKDNLESRLILLRKRLEQKCPEVRLVPTRRGRFALEVDCELSLVERETA